MSAGEEKKRGERGEGGGKREEKREGRRKQSDMVGEILTTEILSSMSTPPHPVNYHRLIALTRFLHCCTEIEIVDIALLACTVHDVCVAIATAG